MKEGVCLVSIVFVSFLKGLCYFLFYHLNSSYFVKNGNVTPEAATKRCIAQKMCLRMCVSQQVSAYKGIELHSARVEMTGFKQAPGSRELTSVMTSVCRSVTPLG